MANYNENVDLYLNENGDVGVLYSPEYGAGWSTWNEDEFAYDKRIVEKFIEDPEIFHNYRDSFLAEDAAHEPLTLFMASLGYSGYYGGARNLRLIFVPKGLEFRITEYDGHESIEEFNHSDYISF